MSSAQVKDLKKGRVAATTKQSTGNNIPVGVWSVIISDGAKQVNSAGVSGNSGNNPAASRAGRSKNVCDIVFFVDKADAYEESAYLNGKRPGADSEAAARRHRSIGGKVMEMAVHDMGRMGVGLVIGENNVTGISLRHTIMIEMDHPVYVD